MREIVLLIGNVGEGKTTLAKKYQKKGYIVISKDSLRYAVGAGNYIYKKEYEPIIWNIEEDMVNYFMSIGVNIVIDSICVSKSMRLRYISIAKDYHNYKVKCHLLPKLSMKEAINRRMQNPHQQNNRKMWEKIWLKFNKIYQKPTLKEGINKIIGTR